MSLAICIVQKDYIIASSDSAVAYFPPGKDEDGKIKRKAGGIIPTDFKSEKTHLLNSRVILIVTGSSILTTALRIELSHRISEYHDLIRSKEAAREIMINLRRGSVTYRREIAESLSEKLEMEIDFERDLLPEFAYIDGKTDLSAYLVGFTDEGESGMVDIIADYLSKPSGDGKGYPVVLAGPDDKFNKDPEQFSRYQKALSIPVEHRSFDNFMNAIAYVHAHISRDNPANVSPDANLRILVKDEGAIVYRDGTIDTSQFYERLDE